jgi:hypothetical protein
MEIELNGVKLRVYKDGKIERFWKSIDWKEVKGCISKSYCVVSINYKQYFRHRIVAMAYLRLDINNLTTQIDHIDRNKQNNNVSNLRIVSPQQNTFNTNAKGCHWHKKRNKWVSYICINGKTIYLGQFDTEEEANRVYLEAKKIYHII